MRDLAKLRSLTAAEWRLLAFCLAATPLVSGGLALFGYRRMHAAMARRQAPIRSRFASPEDAAARARSVARIVAIAAGRGPVRATCLRRSLLLWWLLRRDGVACAVRVGVRREDGRLHAHAWVEHAGAPLDDDPEIATRFPPFERDFAAPSERAS